MPVHLLVLYSHISSMGKLIIFFLYPPHPLSQFGTLMLCHCRVTLQSHCSCSDCTPPPPTEELVPQWVRAL